MKSICITTLAVLASGFMATAQEVVAPEKYKGQEFSASELGKASNWESGKKPESISVLPDGIVIIRNTGITFTSETLNWNISKGCEYYSLNPEAPVHLNMEKPKSLSFNFTGTNNANHGIDGIPTMLSSQTSIVFTNAGNPTKDHFSITADLAKGNKDTVYKTDFFSITASTGTLEGLRELISTNGQVKTDVFTFTGYTVDEKLYNGIIDEKDMEDGVAYIYMDDADKRMGVAYKGQSAVPEPTTASLGLFGIAGLLLRRRRN